MTEYSSAKDMSPRARLSQHADQRLRQRGFSRPDLELVMTFGETIESRFELTNRAATDRIAELKREIQALSHLRGTRVIVADDVIVTTYRALQRRRRIHRHRRAQSGSSTGG